MIPLQPGEPWPGRDDDGDAGKRGAWLIPTVDHVADAIAAMTADTVLQILRGQGVSYGLGAASGPAPDIRPRGRPHGSRDKRRRRARLLLCQGSGL